VLYVRQKTGYRCPNESVSDSGSQFPISQFPVPIFQFHDSFNFGAELKETLNDSSSFKVPFAPSCSDISFDFDVLREIDLESTPWHMGCKPFRRFEQISL
jgi:hypothetical protein